MRRSSLTLSPSNIITFVLPSELTSKMIQNAKHRFKTTWIAALIMSYCLSSYSNPSIEEGLLAPDFTIELLDGTFFRLSDLKGKKAVYLIFWNTWCNYCHKKIPKIQYAHERLGKQLQIIAINTSLKDSLEETIQFKHNYAIDYPLAFDHGKAITDLYGVWGTPTEFIIDINGVIRHRDRLPDELSNNVKLWNQLNTEETLIRELCEKKQKC